MAKMYYEKDCDLNQLNGKKIAIVGGGPGGGMGGHFRGREDHAADAGGQDFFAEDGCFHGEIASFRG